MKYLIIITMFMSFGSTQVCPDPSMELHIEDISDLNSFIITYGDCPSYTLEGIVVVNAMNVTSFAGLEGLTEITKRVKLIESGFNSLDGLQNLTVIGSQGYSINSGSANSLEFQIKECHNLTNLNALSNLEAVAGNFDIDNNNSLNSIDGLSSLAFVGGEMRIIHNQNLHQCDMLDQCQVQILGGFQLFGNICNRNTVNFIGCDGDCGIEIYGQYNQGVQCECDWNGSEENVNINDFMDCVDLINDGYGCSEILGIYGINCSTCSAPWEACYFNPGAEYCDPDFWPSPTECFYCEDGSTPDCLGQCGGNYGTMDSCGVCDGDNSYCTDCAGIINGTNILDQCGVCNGDNSTCIDDCGTINGDVFINNSILDENDDGYDDISFDAGALSGDLTSDGITNVLDIIALVNLILSRIEE